MHRLSDKEFLKVIAATPLVSIDLIIRNPDNEVLLGRRANRPAQGFWFVPGGRIRKGERVAEAFDRIAKGEIGMIPTKRELLGVFDHIYEDNFLGVKGIGTHYVVLAFEANVPSEGPIKPDAQHSEFRWWRATEAAQAPEVHPNSRAYFE